VPNAYPSKLYYICTSSPKDGQCIPLMYQSPVPDLLTPARAYIHEARASSVGELRWTWSTCWNCLRYKVAVREVLKFKCTITTTENAPENSISKGRFDVLLWKVTAPSPNPTPSRSWHLYPQRTTLVAFSHLSVPIAPICRPATPPDGALRRFVFVCMCQKR